MLDAFIIDRIQREREASSPHARVPLRIEVPLPQPPPPRAERPEASDEAPERGVVDIDFSI